MNRQHVHLSFDRDTATKVGSRHGVCKVLTVKSQEMFEQGFKFYKSENGVWLTDNVPAKYLQF